MNSTFINSSRLTGLFHFLPYLTTTIFLNSFFHEKFKKNALQNFAIFHVFEVWDRLSKV